MHPAVKFKEIPKSVKHISFLSDCCAGHNRNSSLHACSNMPYIRTLPGIDIIDLKFLEPGHTHMECDSMHATTKLQQNTQKYLYQMTEIT